MKRNDTAVRPTGSECSIPSCPGEIVEVFHTTYTQGFHPSETIQHLNFGCSVCGLQYGLPVHKRTMPNEQVQFELSLEVAVLKNAISILRLGGNENANPEGHIEASLPGLKEGDLSDKDEIIKVGTTIYCLPVNVGDTAEMFSRVCQLTTQKGARQFYVIKAVLQ